MSKKKPEVMHGARGKVYIGGDLVGIFSSVSYSTSYDVVPINIIGRFSTADLVTTGVEPISVSLSGYRVINNGPFAGAVKMPKVQDLLAQPETYLQIIDRKNPDRQMLHVSGLKHTGISSGISAKGVQEMSINMLGLVMEDESGDQYDAGAVKLDGTEE